MCDRSNEREERDSKLNPENMPAEFYRMEALGRMVGGVVHDINNYIACILEGCEWIEDAIDKESQDSKELCELVDMMRDASKQAANKTRQLLAFARPGRVQAEPVYINKVVSNINEMLHCLIGEDVRIELDLDDDLWGVNADEDQLAQIIVNLVINARDAMPSGGMIAIKVRNFVSDGVSPMGPVSVPSGKYVLMTVEDDGVGISEENISKVFDPFFTANETGSGAGLGLAVVRGVLESHGGGIAVESARGRGSTFYCWLPCSHQHRKATE